ncbi:MAG: FHA domain-containing protein [Bacteroidales bacterium]|nr:FHA domain-containing protein [Bacteroidales bacterium]
MRLISIGKSTSCTVCIPNDFVSSYHAEILLLDNGDIFLTDCNSKNGTFLNGKRIASNVEVPVRRGDRIEFDNVALNWSSIPQIPLPDPSTVKGLYGIGKSQRNRYNLSGESVSRYHATFKEMKNGKWFIQDHSKNGTFINGNRIPANQDVQIKPSDSIVCGSIPCPNPVPTTFIMPSWTWWVIGGIAAILLFVLGIKPPIPNKHVTDPYKAIVLVQVDYRYKIQFADDPIMGKASCWYFYGNPESDYPMITTDPDKAWTMMSQGTAFFISENGHLLTNRHVTNSIYADENYSGGKKTIKLKAQIEEARRRYVELSGLDEEDMGMLWYKSSFTIEAEPISIAVFYPGRTYSRTSELDYAQLLKESDNPDVDVSILRLNSPKTPDDRDWFNLNNIREAKSLVLNDEDYLTLGFPYGSLLASITDPNTYEPTSAKLHLSRKPAKHILYLQGDKTLEGCSGSPIYDKKSRLIGILWGGYNGPDNTNANPIVEVKNIVDEYFEEENI